ncbi:MAG: YggS family pyridoxal phosphate-dependent enzyme [candidate division KSB1 bacterium]|nr:YggS family pyridoxal phosphate-dependent enzyme [candidate division KSB1 bacterium]MDZ7391806.1 YggS family pyridoxal phosphate-dependent enzyme [candidate division KSB1 bacterium]MDZ7413804.1 YggS family pyridoxal phosphate-dependent enzyme [candidate division KSB1 bacterium]
MTAIEDNVRKVRERIAAACARVGRDPREVTVVAVSKTVEVERIRQAIAAGVTVIGENRVQEAWPKVQAIGRGVAWHMVGHLQTNKVKRALECFDLIQSVDSLHLAEEISRRASACGRRVEVFVEVNTSGESSKFGVPPEQAPELVARIAALPGVRVMGLMTVGALLPDPELVRPCFVTLRQVKEEIDRRGIDNVQLRHLSMGMTDDFEVAVEEGATMVRIGRAIFGPRTDGAVGQQPDHVQRICS